MRRLPRQILSCVTAAFVLGCNVLCACGGHSPVGGGGDDHRACHQTREPEPAKTRAHSHCAGHGPRHDHQHHRQNSGGEERPAPAEPCGGGGEPKAPDPGCQHCNQIVAVPDAKAKAGGDLASHPSLAGFLPPLLTEPPADPGRSRLRVMAGDPSPPTAGPTLLSLHCALTL